MFIVGLLVYRGSHWLYGFLKSHGSLFGIGILFIKGSLFYRGFLLNEGYNQTALGLSVDGGSPDGSKYGLRGATYSGASV